MESGNGFGNANYFLPRIGLFSFTERREVLDEFGFVPPEHLAAITKVEGSARPASSICFAKLCFMLSQFGGLGLGCVKVECCC